ncbi:MAG: hypothetical protein ACHRHE_18290 [Tepidisphaerales bacterium]
MFPRDWPSHFRMLVTVLVAACIVLTCCLVLAWVRWARGSREPRGFDVLPPKERKQ